VKGLSACIGAAGLGCIVWGGLGSRPASEADALTAQAGADERLIVIGNHRGYLSPCGCSDPMLGGILRQASLVRKLQGLGPSTVIDSGDMTGLESRQEEMKAQTLAQVLHSVHVAAINLTPSEIKLGAAELQNLQDLSGSALTSASSPFGNEVAIEPNKVSGSFLIFGLGPLSAQSSSKVDAMIEDSLSEAKNRSLRAILMLEDTEQAAEQLARSHPSLDLIVFRSASAPSAVPKRIGNTLLVSPGEHGEYLLSIGFSKASPPGYARYTLTPDVPDDPTAKRFYSTYLRRVEDDSSLWNSRSRIVGKGYAGAVACAKCHQSDYKIWRDRVWTSNGEPSSHSGALKTLIAKGHGKDPECLPCHVTGADYTTGFHSLKADPQLAFVGCESCHGPGASHSADPWHVKVTAGRTTHWAQSCEKCHTSLNSANFDFAVYWGRIKHGSVDKQWKSKK
jgi:hypothetical protein